MQMLVIIMEQVLKHTCTHAPTQSLTLFPLVSSGCVSNCISACDEGHKKPANAMANEQISPPDCDMGLCMSEISRKSQQEIKVTWSIISNVSERAERGKSCIKDHLFAHVTFSTTHAFFCVDLFFCFVV